MDWSSLSQVLKKKMILASDVLDRRALGLKHFTKGEIYLTEQILAPWLG